MSQSGGARDMIKSGGGKTGSRRRAGSSRGTEDNKIEAEGVDADIARLRQEADELREALASEQQRTKRLEATNATVADRLNRAIASIRQLLERQG
jgi:NTP pyrophosphatase (non-canonical NTP hydrolase)